MRTAAFFLLAGCLSAHGAEPRPNTSPDQPATVTITNLVPALPRAKTPVEVFRDLLAMPPERRSEQLAQKPAGQRQYLLAKLREYDTIPAVQREERLISLQLRWYLRPLLESTPDKRQPILRLIPPELQPLIEKRLRFWDALGPGLQKEILENAWMTRYVFRTGLPEPEPPSPARARSADELAERIDRWKALPEERRRQLSRQFENFFVLGADEQEHTLQILPEPVRQVTESTVRPLENLTPEERRSCLGAFDKFTRLSPTEREQFLQNAQRWLSMSDREKTAWRQLVHQMPPLPPDFHADLSLPPGLTGASPARPAPPRLSGQSKADAPPLPGTASPPMPPPLPAAGTNR